MGEGRRFRWIVLAVASIVVAATVASNVAGAVAPPPAKTADGGSYQALTPTRVVDSRVGLGLDAALVRDAPQAFAVDGVGGVPATGVTAVALNVTVVAPDEDTDVTLWPSGTARPDTSNVNAVAGQTIANFAVVAPGSDGRVAIQNEAGRADVVVDVLGWFDGPVGGRIHAMTATRLVDTRSGDGATGPVGADGVAFDVRGHGGVPDQGVGAVLLDVTGIGASDATHLTVWPDGIAPPATSNLNLAAGETRANLVLVSPGADGRVRVANRTGAVQLAVDVVGYVDAGAATGGQLVPVTPTRIADSRNQTGLPDAPLGPGGSVTVTVTGGFSGVPAGASAVVLNVTGVGASGATHLTVGPAGVPLPSTSNLNLTTGETIANAVLVAVGTSGQVVIRNNSDTVDLVVDVEAYVTAGLTIADDVAANADRCDPIDPSLCLLPFPNDWFTTADPTTATGRRVDLATASTPANIHGVHVDMTRWNGNDGFSPGQLLLAHVPGVDLAASGLPPVTDIGSSLAADPSVVVLDTATGEHYPVWVELDAHATSDANRTLIITPAKQLAEGHHFVVALRHLETAGHQPIAPSDAFRALRDGLVTNVASIESRRGHFQQLFGSLRDAGVDPGTVDLAWDFTIASAQSLAGPLLHLRDQSFAGLGSAAPAFQVTKVEQNPSSTIARRVTGTFTVPNYLTGDGSAGNAFNLGAGGLPVQNGTMQATFQCNLSYATLGAGGGAAPGPIAAAREVIYGHGLLGDESEINAGNVQHMTNDHNMAYCATRWIGLAEDDVPNVVTVLTDLSRFPTIADRLQQGVLNTLWLGRLMRLPQGLGSDPAFQGPQGQALLDTSELYYDGNSQGGIMGGIATAVSQEWTRAVLGVPGEDYSILLPRSSDYTEFGAILNGNYANELERPLLLDLIQMLWDRGEASGFVQHLVANPYPGTPKHTVLLHEAFGDFQVANVSTEVEARTLGIPVHQPALGNGRSPDVTPLWGLAAIPGSPFDGSALVVWDGGTAAPPTVGLPPTVGDDPHEFPRATPAAQQQKSDFLQPAGRVADVCAGAPCLSVTS
jgi:hypothetical protein